MYGIIAKKIMSCKTLNSLGNAYSAIVHNYSINAIDLDEFRSLTDMLNEKSELIASEYRT